MKEDNIYRPPAAEVRTQRDGSMRSGLTLQSKTFFVVLVNCFLAFTESSDRELENSMADATGRVIGAIVVPLIVVVLFQVGRKYRTPVARAKLYFWASALLLLTQVVRVGDHAQ